MKIEINGIEEVCEFGKHTHPRHVTFYVVRNGLNTSCHTIPQDALKKGLSFRTNGNQYKIIECDY